MFKFLVYVDDPGGALTDVSLSDLLDPAFAYLGGSIKVTNARVVDCGRQLFHMTVLPLTDHHRIELAVRGDARGSRPAS